MRRVRPAMRGAIIASVVLHALLLMTFVEVSRDRQAALVAPAEQPEQAPIEVEILADPRAGAPDGDTAAEDDQTIPPPTSPPTEPAAASQAAPATTLPAATPPPETAESPPVPAPPPPVSEPSREPQRTPARTATAPPTPRLPPARARAGSGAEGRADGTTDIIIGANTVPASPDPSHYNIPPRYPREAAQRGQQGLVQLSVVVATDGSALSVEVAESSGFPILDRAARDAVAKWHFRPGKDGGLAVPSTIPVNLSFILDNAR